MTEDADNDLRYWIGFNRVQGIGPIRLRALIQHFGDVRSAWNAKPAALAAAGLDQRSLASFLKTHSTCDLDNELRTLQRLGVRVITILDADYPPLLRQIPDAPPMLYVKGALTDADHRAMAVVGTRRATTYGKTIAAELCVGLVQAGITIISGLARGIDAMAHQAALEAGGRTIAVLATGIDQVYPPEHKALAAAIVENGALITELPLGEPPERSHFVPRNRIISGLSLGVVVVEADEKSGALKTADQALDQGRDVFAVPGNTSSPTSRGTNGLIRSGAKMVISTEDILSEITDFTAPKIASRESQPKVRPVGTPSRRIIEVSPPAKKHSAAVLPSDPVQLALLHCLSDAPQDIDALIQCSGLSVKQVASTLTLLEINGFIQQVGVLSFVLAPMN